MLAEDFPVARVQRCTRRYLRVNRLICTIIYTTSLTNRAETAKTREKAIARGQCPRDLIAKLFGAAEFFLFAKALPEVDFDSLSALRSPKN